MKKRIFVLFLLFFISIACVSANEDINASETLNLYDGEILTSQDFNQLQNLYLSNNKISDIKVPYLIELSC